MMVNDKQKILEGKIEVRDYVSGEIIHSQNNNIVSNGLAIAIRCLAGVDQHIDQISTYDSGSLLASNQIDSITYPQNNIVEFTTIFGFTDFSGTYDELVLQSSKGGRFSEVTGLSLSKSSSQKISVSWQIKIT